MAKVNGRNGKSAKFNDKAIAFGRALIGGRHITIFGPGSAAVKSGLLESAGVQIVKETDDVAPAIAAALRATMG